MHPAFLALFILAVLLYLLVSLIRPLPPFRKRLHVLLLGIPGGVFAILVMMVIAGLTTKTNQLATEPTGTSESVVSDGANAEAPSVAAATDEQDGSKQEIVATAEEQAANTERQDFAISALTHHNKAMGKRVTYRDPRTARIERSEFSKDDWTINADHADVICFADGNNAVFLAMNGAIVAANGKARQFVDHADGDGIVLKDGTLQPVLEPDLEKNARLLNQAIRVGLELCGQKDLDEITRAAKEAAEPADGEPQSKDALYLDAALVMVGAKICGYKLDAVALVDHLQANGIDQADFRAEITSYLGLAEGVLKAGDQSFCEEELLPKFGKDGFGFVSE
ncbi:MAG: hypothetical protein M9955_22400 [Rhizobiaceae bacterium]|nr:hypothetical protein [Rhizobiaceae bacterium]